MGVAKPAHRYTPAEYYLLEEKAEYKSDYYDGEIFAMAGGTLTLSAAAPATLSAQTEVRDQDE